MAAKTFTPDPVKPRHQCVGCEKCKAEPREDELFVYIEGATVKGVKLPDVWLCKRCFGEIHGRNWPTPSAKRNKATLARVTPPVKKPESKGGSW